MSWFFSNCEFCVKQILCCWWLIYDDDAESYQNSQDPEDEYVIWFNTLQETETHVPHHFNRQHQWLLQKRRGKKESKKKDQENGEKEDECKGGDRSTMPFFQECQVSSTTPLASQTQTLEKNSHRYRHESNQPGSDHCKPSTEDDTYVLL